MGYAGGINLYAYCRNNPVNLVDPSGLCPNSEDQDWQDIQNLDRFRHNIPNLFAQTLLNQDENMVLTVAGGAAGPLEDVGGGLGPMDAGGGLPPEPPVVETPPDRLVRVVESKYVDGPNLSRVGQATTWVSPAEDIEGYDGSANDLGNRMGLDPNEDDSYGPYAVHEFDNPGGIGPTSGSSPGANDNFVPGGYTSGGAREYSMANLPLTELENLVTRLVF